MDANVAKDFRLLQERVFATLSFQFVNVFNHAIMNDPSMDISDAANFGVINGQANSPRRITFNLRLRF